MDAKKMIRWGTVLSLIGFLALGVAMVWALMLTTSLVDVVMGNVNAGFQVPLGQMDELESQAYGGFIGITAVSLVGVGLSTVGGLLFFGGVIQRFIASLELKAGGKAQEQKQDASQRTLTEEFADTRR